MTNSELKEQIDEEHYLNKQKQQQQQLVYSQLFPFLSFGQRLLKNSHYVAFNHNNYLTKKQSKIIHDKEQYMFIFKLNSKGKTAALCYLPTRVKRVIEVYHIEIPVTFRHMGIGDKLVKECLNWAKESRTLVIPTCSFVKRHLELFDYDSVIVNNEQEAMKRFAKKSL